MQHAPQPDRPMRWCACPDDLPAHVIDGLPGLVALCVGVGQGVALDLMAV